MFINKGLSNLSLTQKICLTGLLVALTTILQKVIAINYLAALPFFRLSFGAPALIVFASIFLGPFWGAAVGVFSDILGYFAFDVSSYAFKPQISLIYLVLGFVSFFVYKLISKSDIKKTFLIEVIVLLGFLIFVSCYLIFFFDCSIYAKIFIPLGLTISVVILLIFQNVYRRKNMSIPVVNISFSYLICDFLVLLIFGSLMKAWAFSIYYDSFISLFILVFATQSLVLIVNVFFNTILLTTFFRLTKKYMR